MQTKLNKKLLRDGLIALAVVAIMLNIAFGLNALSQNKVSDLKGNRLAQSWDLQFRLEQLKSLITNPNLPEQSVRIRQSLRALDRTRFEPSNVFILNELENVISKKDDFHATRLIEELYNSELRHLRAAIDQNNIQEIKAETSLMITLAVNLAFILIFSTGIMFYIRNQISNKANIAESLNNIQGALFALDQLNIQREAPSKTPLQPALGLTEFIEADIENRTSVTESSEMIKSQ